MELLLALWVAIMLLIAFSQLMKRSSPRQALRYRYLRKDTIMTKNERSFAHKLHEVIGAKYYIVPQAHLSVFLDEKIKGQNWRAAFRRINGKSVDFLQCEKTTSRPVLAIELDDYTHQRQDRIIRDQFVESICDNAGILLVRFTKGEWDSERAIYDKIVQQKATKRTSSTS